MALLFDGTNDKVDHGDINAIDGAETLSAAWWYYPGNNPPFDGQAALMFGKTAGVNTSAFRVAHGAVHTGVAANDWAVYLRQASSDGNNRYGVSSNVFSSAAWYHLAFSYNGAGATDADKLKLYMNGTAETVAVPNANLSTALPSNATPVTVGCTDGNTGDLTGRIAHLKIWTAELSASELLKEMHSYRAQRRDSLVLDSTYEDKNSATDYSDAKNHGTISGAVYTDGPAVPYGGE